LPLPAPRAGGRADGGLIICSMKRTIEVVNKGLFAVLFLLFSSILVSCGIPDDYRYLEPVDYVKSTMNQSVDIKTPDSDNILVTLNFSSSSIPSITSENGSLTTFFSHYDLYYRIYIIPGSADLAVDPSQYSTISPALYSDYYYLNPFTAESSNTTWGNINTTAQTNWKKISEKSGPYLLRSDDLIDPYPKTYVTSQNSNYYFFNDPDLRSSQYLNSNNNADVAANTSTGSSSFTSTCVSIYVVHTDFNPTTLAPIYSCPTWLGLFLLPESTNAQTVTINSITANGGASTVSTTTITFNISPNITGFALTDISIDDNATDDNDYQYTNLGISETALSPGIQAGSGWQYGLTINSSNTIGIIQKCNIKVSLSHAGYSIAPDNVDVYLILPVITADGGTSTPTTKLTLNLGKDGLTADNISITGLPASGSVQKGTLTSLGSGQYELGMTQTGTGAIQSATISVSASSGNETSAVVSVPIFYKP